MGEKNRFASVALLASPTERAQEAATRLRGLRDWAPIDAAEAVVVLGGDGFMLQVLHQMLDDGRVIPAYGIPELACDGVLLSTPAGSTAYNFSANGPILPLTSETLALTPISPFRPRRWRGAILPDSSQVIFRVLEPDKRPVAAVADQKEVRDIAEVRLAVDHGNDLTLLFDPGHSLDERIVSEQFVA